MKKMQFSSFALALFLLISLALPAAAIEEMWVEAEYAVLIDATYGDILYEQNAYQRTYPASTTKVMTALLVMEALEAGTLTSDQLIPCTADALADITADSSTQNISVGESLSVLDLLYCLLLPSANEAANILAIAVSGDIATFVAQMNSRSVALGCGDTQFMNPHGLHNDDHYTTAYDMALILQEAMTYPLFVEIISTATYITAATETKSPREFYNSNGLISSWYYSGYTYSKAIGGKTGYTPEAGRCLAVAAQESASGEVLISVILGADNVVGSDGSTNRLYFSESARLLEWGFTSFQRTTISPGDTPVAAMPVTLSQETDEVLLRPVGSIQRTLPVDMDLSEIVSEIQLTAESIEAPVEEGDVLGSYTLSYQGEVYGVLDLVALTSVTRSDLLDSQAEFTELLELWTRVTSETISLSPIALVAIGVGLLILVVILAMILARHNRAKTRKKVVQRGTYSGRR